MGKDRIKNRLIRLLLQFIILIKWMSCDFGNLIILELQLARKSLARIIILSLFLSIFSATIWVLLVSMLIIWLNSFGLSWLLAFLFTTLFNAVLALVLMLLLFRSMRSLSFTATRRQLALMRRSQ